MNTETVVTSSMGPWVEGHLTVSGCQQHRSDRSMGLGESKGAVVNNTGPWVEGHLTVSGCQQHRSDRSMALGESKGACMILFVATQATGLGPWDCSSFM